MRTAVNPKHKALFRALSPTTGGMVTALRQWARENGIDDDVAELAIRFRREHASNLADTQVERLMVLLQTVGGKE